MNATKFLVLASLLLCPGIALAQSANLDTDKGPEKENEIAVFELGPAVGHALKGGGSSFGPDLAVEVTPIENWLELEAGVTPLFGRHSREWDTDLPLQEALETFPHSGAYGRSWSGVDSYERIRRGKKLTRRLCRSGFYVLALRQASIRLVSRTGLRPQLWAGPRAICRHKLRPSDCDPMRLAFFAGVALFPSV